MTTQTEALKRIAAYPFSRAEELSVEQMREIAREALAQPEQEPVAHRDGFWCKDLTCKKCYSADFRFKHTTPPQRTWVGLTDEERGALTSGMVKGWVVEQLAIAIEAKLKEKNT